MSEPRSRGYLAKKGVIPLKRGNKEGSKDNQGRTGFQKMRKALEKYPEVGLILREVGYVFQIQFREKMVDRTSTGQVPDKYRTSTGQVPDKYRTSTGQVPDKYRTSIVQNADKVRLLKYRR